MRRIAVAAAVVVLASCGGAEPRGIDLPSATPVPVTTVPAQRPVSTPPLPVPQPTLAVNTPLPSAPPGYARVQGTIVDKDSHPIAGAEIEFQPFGTVVRADPSGHYDVLLAVGNVKCVWTSVEVRATGYGSLLVYDQPMYASSGAWDMQVQPGSTKRYVGPPMVDVQLGRGACPTGLWIPFDG